jgi:hypothetical protein
MPYIQMPIKKGVNVNPIHHKTIQTQLFVEVIKGGILLGLAVR